MRLRGTRTVRPWPGDGGEDGLADPPDGVGDELDALTSGSNFRAAVRRPTLPSPMRSVRAQAAVLVLLGDRDDEAEVALDQLLHRVLVAGADPAGDGDFLLRGEEGRLADLEEVLVENVASAS